MTTTADHIAAIREALAEPEVACFPDFTKAVFDVLAEIDRLKADLDDAIKWRDTYLRKHNGERATFVRRAGELWQPIYDRAIAENDRLKAENEQMRAALEPFSKYAGPIFERNFNVGDVVSSIIASDGGEAMLLAGDFFIARAALKGDTHGN